MLRNEENLADQALALLQYTARLPERTKPSYSPLDAISCRSGTRPVDLASCEGRPNFCSHNLGK